MTAEVGCQVINMAVVSIPNECMPQLMMAVEAKKGDDGAITISMGAPQHCRHLVHLSVSEPI